MKTTTIFPTTWEYRAAQKRAPGNTVRADDLRAGMAVQLFDNDGTFSRVVVSDMRQNGSVVLIDFVGADGTPGRDITRRDIVATVTR